MKHFIATSLFKFLHFLFLIFPAFSLDIFIDPPNSNQCSLKISNPCTGSQNNPYDNLMMAFIKGVSQAIQSNDLSLNYYLSPTNITDGHLIIHPSSNNGTISPFETYFGLFLCVKKIISLFWWIGEINIKTWTNESESAKILVKNDNFIMLVNKGLTIKNIVFMGFDMHMANYSCIEDFCCWPNPEISLFNSSDICYLEQRSMVSKNESFLGFFQISTFNNKRNFHKILRI